MTSALCHDLAQREGYEAHDALFFADDSPAGKAAQAEAKRLCLACPLYWQCAEVALEEGIPHGVFGGLSAEDRKHIWKRTGKPVSAWVRTPVQVREAFERRESVA